MLSTTPEGPSGLSCQCSYYYLLSISFLSIVVIYMSRHSVKNIALPVKMKYVDKGYSA
jgi:hypothetical protein